MGDLCSVFLKGFRPERYEYAYRVKEEVFVDPRAERFSGESISENGIRKPAVLCFAAVFL